jgi:predicted NBD/HSP70 family sugar kinase/biotin operon repressor
MSNLSDAPRASLDLLRRITDRHVVDQLLGAATMTRAEIAARTGISKPTISESMRRLEDAGLVVTSGHEVGKRGRAGTYFALRADVGVALAVSAGPTGLVAEVLDVRGAVVRHVERAVASPITSADLIPLLTHVVSQATSDAPGPVLGAAMSVAGPVEPATGRLLHLPDSPFLVDELNARAVVSGVTGADVEVDNDVNWAALAEYHGGNASGLDDFCYCHFGYGLGGAVVRGGEVVRGTRGLAGEIAHIRTEGPRERSMRLVECFAAWDLVQPASSAIDVPRLSTILEGATAADRRQREGVIRAVAGAVGSITAFLNPTCVVIGGPWSSVGGFNQLLAERLHQTAVVDAEVRPAALGDEASLVGVRVAALRAANRRLLAGRSTR